MNMLVDNYFKTGREFLGCDIPIMCGAMTWVSDCRLVGAMGNAGGFGLLAGGNAPVDVLENEILATRKETDKPFGVNLVTLSPNYRDQLQMVCEQGCQMVVFAGGIPRSREIQKARDAGAKAVCFAPTDALAKKLIDMGADALILEGSEAGGHIGPVSLLVLIQQILFSTDQVPIFVAGGIASGRMMAHLLMMGAAGVQMGTRFVMSQECNAHASFKNAFQKAKARDAIATPQMDARLPVIPVRALKNEGTSCFCRLQLDLLQKIDQKQIDRQEAMYEVEGFWMGALRKAVVEGDIRMGSLMAGQSVGLVNRIQPLKEIIEEMVNEAEAELQRVKKISDS